MLRYKYHILRALAKNNHWLKPYINLVINGINAVANHKTQLTDNSEIDYKCAYINYFYPQPLKVSFGIVLKMNVVHTDESPFGY